MSDCMLTQDGILAGKWVIITGILQYSLSTVVDCGSQMTQPLHAATVCPGASRGIGQAIAEQMADEKANLILLAQREGALKEVMLLLFMVYTLRIVKPVIPMQSVNAMGCCALRAQTCLCICFLHS